jgi:hypothetical protein
MLTDQLGKKELAQEIAALKESHYELRYAAFRRRQWTLLGW